MTDIRNDTNYDKAKKILDEMKMPVDNTSVNNPPAIASESSNSSLAGGSQSANNSQPADFSGDTNTNKENAQNGSDPKDARMARGNSVGQLVNLFQNAETVVELQSVVDPESVLKPETEIDSAHVKTVEDRETSSFEDSAINNDSRPKEKSISDDKVQTKVKEVMTEYLSMQSEYFNEFVEFVEMKLQTADNNMNVDKMKDIATSIAEEEVNKYKASKQHEEIVTKAIDAAKKAIDEHRIKLDVIKSRWNRDSGNQEQKITRAASVTSEA
eukprot:gene32982-42092_t